MSISQAIQQLKNYSGPLGLTLRTGATEEQLAEVERCYGVMLPDDFKELYRFTNGFETEQDIFNMIPLAEIISNKEDNNPLWIAEYLIYSDMWALEINTDDRNDYSIVNVDDDYDRLVLTNSLAEFIQAFLKGGLYNEDGLFDLHSKRKTEILSATNVTEIAFSVFYHGIRLGLIKTEEVRAVVDKLIPEQSNPDFFLIEISLCNNINDMISLLEGRVPSFTHRIVHRVLLGLTYQKLQTGMIDLDHISRLFTRSVLGSFTLNYYEKEVFEQIADFFEPEYIGDNDKELDALVVPFFSNYSPFTLSDYNDWLIINTEVENSLYSFYTSLAERKEIARKQSQEVKQRKLWLLLIYGLGVFSVIVLLFNTTKPISKFGADLYDFCLLYLFFFSCYHILWLAKKILLRISRLFFH